MIVNDIAEYGDTVRLDKLTEAFRTKYEGRTPNALIRVPGRINLIGEHIDYSDYGVLPMAIQKDILVAMATVHNESYLQLSNLESSTYSDLNLSNYLSDDGITINASIPNWHNYFLAGCKGLLDRFLTLAQKSNFGLCFLVDGQIPVSAGCSSSSALVVAASLCLVYAFNLKLEKEELAELCAKSEHFVGTMGGGMDQAIEILATAGAAIFIEFNPLQTTSVKLPTGLTFVVINSLVEANKAAGTAFNSRVTEIRQASQIILRRSGMNKVGPVSLREIQRLLSVDLRAMMSSLESFFSKDEKVLYSRAIHVYSEAQRVLDFISICSQDFKRNKDSEKQDFILLGDLLTQSHESLKENYECSHPRLDELVSLSLKYGALGARLTGAGWGGCVIALVPSSSVPSFKEGIFQDYFSKSLGNSKLSLESVLFETEPCDGASIYKF